MGLSEAIGEQIRERVGEIKDAPGNLVRAEVGGIVDATALNALNVIGDAAKGVVLPAAATVGQPLLRAFNVGKEVLTLHPGRAVGEAAVGTYKLIDGGISTVEGAVKTVGNAVRRVAFGAARMVGGLGGEDIASERYDGSPKPLSIDLGLQPPKTGDIAEEPATFKKAA